MSGKVLCIIIYYINSDNEKYFYMFKDAYFPFLILVTILNFSCKTFAKKRGAIKRSFQFSREQKNPIVFL
jgi:hypothetical protein